MQTSQMSQMIHTLFSSLRFSLLVLEARVIQLFVKMSGSFPFSVFSAHLIHWLDLMRVGSHLTATDVIHLETQSICANREKCF